jgi:hypothetical protein
MEPSTHRNGNGKCALLAQRKPVSTNALLSSILRTDQKEQFPFETDYNENNARSLIPTNKTMMMIPSRLGLLLSMFVVSTLAWQDCLLDPECRNEVCLMFDSICGPHGTCQKALLEYPYFKCSCDEGYANLTPSKCVADSFHLDRIGCMNDDECTDSRATCQLVGGNVYQCACEEGYIGNGNICHVNDNPVGESVECPLGSDFCSGEGSKCVMDSTQYTAMCVCEDDVTKKVMPSEDCS